MSPALAEAARIAGLSERATRLLAGRGVDRPVDLAAHLGDPRGRPPRSAAAARCGGPPGRASPGLASQRERVLVLGDFDADGLTGLAILVTALRRLGLDVGWHVPAREAEGHGLSLAAIERAAAEGRSLVITVDTGSSSVAEVALAASRGIDVIVTDHHHVPPVPPAAVALVNPHRHDSVYPDARLAGSGVAFKVAQLLLADEPGGPAAALDLADLAVIGTIADVAPIAGENRAIARLGLARLRTAPRPGIAALLAAAGVAPQRVDLERIGFALAPRLNAGGRMGDVATAANLLLATDAAVRRTSSPGGSRRPIASGATSPRRSSMRRTRRSRTCRPDPSSSPGRGRSASSAWSPAASRRIGEPRPSSSPPAPSRGAPPAGGRPAASSRPPSRRAPISSSAMAATRRPPGASSRRRSTRALRERLLPLLAIAAGDEPHAAAGPKTLLLDLAVDAAEVDYRLLHDFDPLGPDRAG